MALTDMQIRRAQWRIPPERTKMGSEHIVPLSTQAISVIRDLEKLNTGRRYLLSGQAIHERPMSENTMLYALYRGYHSRATMRGFGAIASAILNEQGFRPDVIERQLAHIARNKVRAAYHRGEYLPERRKMMQHWADYLDAQAGAAQPLVARDNVTAAGYHGRVPA